MPSGRALATAPRVAGSRKAAEAGTAAPAPGPATVELVSGPDELTPSAATVGSSEHLPAVDDQRLACHPRRRGTAQEDGDVGHLLGVAEAARGDGVEDGVVELRLARLAPVPDAAGELDGARRDGVDADALGGQHQRLR